MEKGKIYMYYGEGKGKTALAIGMGMGGVGDDLSVVMIQFMDYNNKAYVPLKNLEPQFRVFSFQKKKENANKEEAEVKGEVKIAFNFCKKILETDDCEILILDGILDALELGFIDEDELINVLNERSDSMGIIITGRKKNHKVSTLADYIFHIIPEKVF